ncbi:MAG TPA: beta-ketoacyl-ACP synthase II [Phycisphaerae bacterium]|nr:beta-ketoacyl-ACP synthase II [Phycisphaerae bacterium]
MDADPSPPRIVVTGLGVVTALGCDVGTFWANILAGRNGITHVTQFDATGFSCRIGAEVRDFDPTRYMDPKEVRRNDRYTHFGFAAAKMAVADAGLTLPGAEGDRVGVIIGSGIGGMHTYEQQLKVLWERGPRKVSPFTIPSLISNMCSGLVAIEFGARGPNYGVVSACASSAHAIGEASNAMRRGEADVMLAGGSEAAITPFSYAGFCSMKAMSTRNEEPHKACRPFEKNRDGFIMGEGAGVLVLETLEHARARGASVYCELVGYGATCDAFHITQPDPDGHGLSLAMTRALASARLRPDQVDYLNAHGTSTPLGDKAETTVVKSVFGDYAYNVPISSIKSTLGHMQGACGSIEVAACCLAIRDNVLPPTINYEYPDPECDLDYVPNVARHRRVDIAASNSFSFGGRNTAVVIRRHQDERSRLSHNQKGRSATHENSPLAY